MSQKTMTLATNYGCSDIKRQTIFDVQIMTITLEHNNQTSQHKTTKTYKQIKHIQ